MEESWEKIREFLEFVLMGEFFCLIFRRYVLSVLFLKY